MTEVQKHNIEPAEEDIFASQDPQLLNEWIEVSKKPSKKTSEAQIQKNHDDLRYFLESRPESIDIEEVQRVEADLECLKELYQQIGDEEHRQARRDLLDDFIKTYKINPIQEAQIRTYLSNLETFGPKDLYSIIETAEEKTEKRRRDSRATELKEIINIFNSKDRGEIRSKIAELFNKGLGDKTGSDLVMKMSWYEVLDLEDKARQELHDLGYFEVGEPVAVELSEVSDESLEGIVKAKKYSEEQRDYVYEIGYDNPEDDSVYAAYDDSKKRTVEMSGRLLGELQQKYKKDIIDRKIASLRAGYERRTNPDHKESQPEALVIESEKNAIFDKEAYERASKYLSIKSNENSEKDEKDKKEEKKKKPAYKEGIYQIKGSDPRTMVVKRVSYSDEIKGYLYTVDFIPSARKRSKEQTPAAGDDFNNILSEDEMINIIEESRGALINADLFRNIVSRGAHLASGYGDRVRISYKKSKKWWDKYKRTAAVMGVLGAAIGLYGIDKIFTSNSGNSVRPSQSPAPLSSPKTNVDTLDEKSTVPISKNRTRSNPSLFSE